MRVTKIADLAGTTPRAVRHYHRLGLLEVPPTVRGRREYGVGHLARLLRIRWLADSGLSLRQVAEVLAPDPAVCPERPGTGSHRQVVLSDLRAVRDTISAQRRLLAEQAQRIDALISRVEAGQALAPVPSALTCFYDALEARVRALGGDVRSVHMERQMVLVLGSLGMVPDSVVPFIEALDDAELDMCAQQITTFAHLAQLPGGQGVTTARDLAARSMDLISRHKHLTLAVLGDLPDGVMGHAMWHLVQVLSDAGYPCPAQHTFASRLLELLLADPDFAATIRRSAGKDPVL